MLQEIDKLVAQLKEVQKDRRDLSGLCRTSTGGGGGEKGRSLDSGRSGEQGLLCPAPSREHSGDWACNDRSLSSPLSVGNLRIPSSRR